MKLTSQHENKPGGQEVRKSCKPLHPDGNLLGEVGAHLAAREAVYVATEPHGHRRRSCTTMFITNRLSLKKKN